MLLLAALVATPLSATILPLAPATQAYANSLKQLTFCYPATLPPPYLLAQGGGLLNDQITRLAKQLPVALLFQQLPDWQAVHGALLQGQCDIAPHIGTVASNLPNTWLSRPMMETDTAVLYRGKLPQATFLAYAGSYGIPALREIYPAAAIRILAPGESLYEAMQSGKDNAYFGDYLQLRYLMKEFPVEGLRLRRLFGVDRVISYRLMMREEPELVDLVDTAIRYMPAGSLYTDLDHYLDQSEITLNQLHFSDTEQAWLASSRRTVRLVVNPELMPYSGLDEQGNPKGWSADVLRWITQETGLRYEVVPALSKADAIEKLRRGDADMMAGLPESPILANEFTFSRMISINRFALISKRAFTNTHISDLKQQRILVPESLYDPSLLDLLGEQEWIRIGTLEQGLDALRQGEADAMLSELYQLQYPQRTQLLEGLEIKEMEERFGIGFAIRHDEIELASVLDRSLMSLTSNRINELNQRWRRLIVVQQPGVSYLAWFGSVGLALLISAIVIGVIWRSRQQLAREVAQRQAAERALAIESELRDTLFQTLPLPVFMRDSQGRIIKSNKQGRRLAIRYGDQLALPPVQVHKEEGEILLGEQVFAFVQHPLPRDKQTPVTDLIALSDISVLQERARILRQAERRLRALTNTVPGVVLQFLFEGGRVRGIEFISRGCYGLLGLASQQIRRDPRQVFALLSRHELRQLRSTMLERLQAGKPFVHTLRYRHPQHQERWLQLDGRGRRLGQGWRVYAVMQDVTARIEQEQALQRAHEQAQQAALAKGRFLAAVSHEIRTPMNAILGLLEWLASTQLTREQGSALARVRQAGDELLGLLNDVLDFSRNESRKLSLSPQPTDFIELCEQVAAVHWAKGCDKGLQLRLALDPSLPALQTLDPHRIRQILHNLLSNAIKFSQRGEVVLWATRAGDKLRFGVDDEGPGITAEMRPSLFMPFEQFAVAGQLRASGTGLGLAICKQLVEQMGGMIDVAAREEGGSRFFCEFPLDVIRQTPHWRSEMQQLTLEMPAAEVERIIPWLTRLGIDVVPDAADVLAARQTVNGLWHWQWAGESWVPGTLISLLQPQWTPDKLAVNHQPGLNTRVLLVEDDDVNRELITLQLRQLGAWVVAAANGQLALQLLAEQEADLVLTDLQMPVMNGAALCRALRSSPRWCHLPVYVITADLSEQAVIELQSCGCDGHLDKPVARRELATLLQQLNGVGLETEREMPRSPLLTDELIGLYLETTRRDIAELAKNLANKDISGVEAALHKVKGAARMVGATPIIAVIEEWQHEHHAFLQARLSRALDEVSRRLTKRAEDDHHR